MIESIICNNCAAGAIMHTLGMEFKTPTINLQILPEEFPRFCNHLMYYTNISMREYTDISARHEKYLNKMFGCVPDMPLGILDDIVVCFQHYNTFVEGRQKWDERSQRIDYQNMGYIFHLRGEEYRSEAETFARLQIPNSLILCEGFDVDGGIRFDPGEGNNAFSAVNGQLLITQIYDFKKWREQDVQD